MPLEQFTGFDPWAVIDGRGHGNPVEVRHTVRLWTPDDPAQWLKATQETRVGGKATTAGVETFGQVAQLAERGVGRAWVVHALSL